LRKRRVGGVGAARRNPGIAGGGQRTLLGGVRLIDLLVERVLVDVAVQRRRADIAVVGVARERERVAQLLRALEVERQRAVLGRVGRGIEAGPVVRNPGKV